MTDRSGAISPALTERLAATYRGAVSTDEIVDCLVGCHGRLLGARTAGVSVDELEAMTRRRLTERIATRRT